MFTVRDLQFDHKVASFSMHQATPMLVVFQGKDRQRVRDSSFTLMSPLENDLRYLCIDLS